MKEIEERKCVFRLRSNFFSNETNLLEMIIIRIINSDVFSVFLESRRKRSDADAKIDGSMSLMLICLRHVETYRTRDQLFQSLLVGNT